MEKTLFSVLRILILTTLHAALVVREVRSQDSTVHVPKDVIRLSVFHLLLEPKSLQIAYEHRFLRQVSTQIDVGYVFRTGQHNGVRDVRGWRLKEEIRYYFFGRRDRKNHYDYYLSAEVHQNIFSYIELDHPEKYHELGYGFKAGFSEYLNRINLDFNTGASVCYSRSEPIDIFGALFDWENTRGYFIRPILSFRVGYIIR